MDLSGAVVAVTGGRGFFGSHLSEELRSAGAEVHALGQTDYDLRLRAETERMLAELRPDAVVHLAAVVGGIGANRAEPGRFLYENAIMGLELLDACRVAEVQKIVVAGTVCEYPKHTPVPFREDDLWKGYPEETNAPYGLAKKLTLVQAQAYRDQYGTNALHLLPVNLYGPGDNFDLETGHVIPGMIRRFAEAVDAGLTEVVLWGDGSPTREFIYVGDAARAFRLALERFDGSAPVNIGSGTEISIRDLATTIAGILGYEGDVRWDTSKPNGQPRRSLDTSRASELFGFEASTTFADGLAATIAWFREHQADIS